TGSASVHVTVGNTAPTVVLQAPADGQPFEFGDKVPFKVKVTDPEDGTIDCSKVKVTHILGHDSHGHPVTSANGCSGTIQTSADSEHDANANVFGVFDAEYTDQGANGQPALTTHDQHVTQPKHRQAEHYGDSKGVTIASHTPANGGKTVGDINNGDWISFKPYVLSNATSFTARVASAGSGGTLEIRSGSATGRLLGSAKVEPTGSWETYKDVTGTISRAPAKTTTLYLVFKGAGTDALFDVDDFTFTTS
ncbi:carbohydrate-binding protein, partial [Streptomyces sp. NPDC056728]